MQRLYLLEKDSLLQQVLYMYFQMVYRDHCWSWSHGGVVLPRCLWRLFNSTNADVIRGPSRLL